MQVKIQDTGRGRGIQTLVFNPETNRHFVVSSVKNDDLNISETLIFRADEEGLVTNYEDIWSTISVQHEDVIRLLEEGVLTEKYFIMEEK